MAEGSGNYVWVGSEAATECKGCSELRKEVDNLKNMLMSSSVRQADDDRCYSTYISEHKRAEIDKVLLEARHKCETFQEAYEKTLQKCHELLAENDRLKNELDEKANEIAVLKVQTTEYAADFQQEREDRTRSQSRVIELEEQLAAASQRIAELEDDRRRVSATARHQNASIPVHREYVAQPGVYAEHHLPSYSSVCQPCVTHHSRHSQRSFNGGYDVCDS